MIQFILERKQTSMNNNIIKDLLTFLQKYIPGAWNDLDLYDSISETVSEKSDNNILNLEKIITNLTGKSQNQKIIENIYNDKNGIINLYNKYNSPIENGKTPKHLLTELFYNCLAKNTSKFSSYYSKLLPRPETFKKTIGRMNDATTLKTALDKYHKIVLSGDFGCGKSHFIKYCLKMWEIKNFCYIGYDIDNDIKTTLHKILYIDSYGNEYFGSAAPLQEDTFSSALLVIDNMYFSPEMEEELKYLSRLKINIIVITLCPTQTDLFYHYELPQLSDEDLLNIYKADSGFEIRANNPLQKQLLTITGHNILLISLVGKLCSKTFINQPHEEKLKNILEYFMCSDKISNEINTFNYKHQYDNKSINIIGHIKMIYNFFSDYLSSEQLVYMEYLCCFGNSQLPLDFVSLIMPEPDYKKEDLNALHNLGLILLTEDTVQLSSVTFYAVFFKKKPDTIFMPKNVSSIKKGKFEKILNNLKYFLETYDNTLSIPYLSNALLLFAQSLYTKVPSQNNKDQKKTAQQYEYWQDLIYLIENYYNQNGDYFIANKITSIIKYPETTTHTHSTLDTAFFCIANNMQIEEDKYQIPNELETLYFIIKKIQKNIKSTDTISNDIIFLNTSSFIINSMDTAISLYCINSINIITSPKKQEDTKKHQENVITLMNQLLSLIDNLIKQNIFFLSDEKVCYYNNCHLLITNSSPEEITFIQSYELSQEWQNINYRIRNAAVTLFIQSVHWLSTMQDTFKSYHCVLPRLFNSYINPVIKYLRIQIQKCKFIPIQTFRLCFYTYLAVLTMQQILFLTANPQVISACISINEIQELINHSLLSKEEIEKAMKQLEKYF